MKKLFNKRGTVLFLVVVVMAILLVAASATYYVVRNQHASANVHYNSEQSYQTAYSVSDSLKAYFTDQIKKINSKEISFSDSVFDKIWNEPTPLTGANDLREFGLGELDITIDEAGSPTVDEDGNETRTFNVTVKADNNGETTTITQVWAISLSGSVTKYFTRFLTSTGEDGVGQDVYLQAHEIFGDAYFENDYTSMNNTRMRKSLYCAGNLVDTSIQFQNASDKEIVVAGNYIIDTPGGSNLTIKRLFVGKDFINKGKAVLTKVVYVCNDLHWNANQATDTTIFIQGDCHLNEMIGSNTVVYVSGDLYIGDEYTSQWGSFWNCGTFYVSGKVYLSSTNGNVKKIYCDGTRNEDFIDDVYNEWNANAGKDWANNNIIFKGEADYVDFDIEAKIQEMSELYQDDNPDTDDVFSDWSDVELYISNSTEKGTYVDWNAERFFTVDKDGKKGEYYDAPTVDLNRTYNYYKNESSKYKSDSVQYIGCVDKGQDEEKILDAEGNPIDNTNFYGTKHTFVATISQSVKLLPCSAVQSFLVIDASEQDIYVYLVPDEDTNTFTFFTSGQSNVIIQGSQSVVFVLPDGANFKLSNQIYVGHIGLARYFSGYDSVKAMWSDNHYALFGDASNKVDSNNAARIELTNTEMFTTDPDTRLTVFNTAKLGSDVHNNVFLVSTGYGTRLELENQYTFCGYIYMPHMIMNFKENTGSFAFVGGLIVGSYYYNSTTSTLAFVDLNPSDVVSKLMSKANGYTLDTNPSDSTEKTYKFDFKGYR